MAARPENITVTVELSPEDRALLKSIAKALGVTDDESFADTVKQFVDRPGEPTTAEEVIAARRLIEQPPAEGDWLLMNDEHEGEDLE